MTPDRDIHHVQQNPHCSGRVLLISVCCPWSLGGRPVPGQGGGRRQRDRQALWPHGGEVAERLGVRPSCSRVERSDSGGGAAQSGDGVRGKQRGSGKGRCVPGIKPAAQSTPPARPRPPPAYRAYFCPTTTLPPASAYVNQPATDVINMVKAHTLASGKGIVATIDTGVDFPLAVLENSLTIGLGARLASSDRS